MVDQAGLARAADDALRLANAAFDRHGDGNVRDSHAANEGRVFAWDTPPPTGHPGEEYGCRCTAEPYDPPFAESMTLRVSGVSDVGPAWTHRDFINHYYRGGRRIVTVRETGHLSAIVASYVHCRGQALERQIAAEARQNVGRTFSYPFEWSYNMQSIVFSIGDTTIGGTFQGSARETAPSVLNVAGTIDFYLNDEFADPLDVGIEIGFPYPIVDAWEGALDGRIYADAARSSYA